MYNISYEYNIDIKNIIKEYLNYIIKHNKNIVSSSFLKFTEFVVHIKDSNIDNIINYFIINMKFFLI